MQIKLKDNASGMVRIAGPGYHREFRREEQPWDISALAGERVGAQGPAETQKRYAYRLGQAAARLWAELQATGYFEESAGGPAVKKEVAPPAAPRIEFNDNREILDRN